jgi:branched-chain amino acid transport system permease protein
VAGSLSFAVNRIAEATNPLVYFQLSIEFLIAVVIGGAATVSGPIIGAIALVVIRRHTDSADDWLPKTLKLGERAPQLAPAMLGGILILLTYVLPDGIVGGIRRLVARVTRPRSGGAGGPSVSSVSTTPDPIA